MRRRTLVILIVIILALVGSFFLYTHLYPTDGSNNTMLDTSSGVGGDPENYESYVPEDINIPLPPPKEYPIPEGDTFTIQTPQGGVVVNNFYMIHPITPDGSGVMLRDGNDYDIFYSIDFGSFTITLEAQPLNELRGQAEQELLNILGISKTNACKLNMHLNVLNGVDPRTDGGADYGLSFCPNRRNF